MLPSDDYDSDDEYFLVETLLMLMWLFQTIYVLHLIYMQVSIPLHEFARSYHLS